MLFRKLVEFVQKSRLAPHAAHVLLALLYTVEEIKGVQDCLNNLRLDQRDVVQPQRHFPGELPERLTRVLPHSDAHNAVVLLLVDVIVEKNGMHPEVAHRKPHGLACRRKIVCVPPVLVVVLDPNCMRSRLQVLADPHVSVHTPFRLHPAVQLDLVPIPGHCPVSGILANDVRRRHKLHGLSEEWVLLIAKGIDCPADRLQVAPHCSQDEIEGSPLQLQADDEIEEGRNQEMVVDTILLHNQFRHDGHIVRPR
mmetsp:Transcript_51043/g.123751  ORF Transcript_51043/g.123751 Transcript_51043/m.123751 type:complete len:253 (-) Transcript_51043:786-1544(-)